MSTTGRLSVLRTGPTRGTALRQQTSNHNVMIGERPLPSRKVARRGARAGGAAPASLGLPAPAAENPGEHTAQLGVRRKRVGGLANLYAHAMQRYWFRKARGALAGRGGAHLASCGSGLAPSICVPVMSESQKGTTRQVTRTRLGLRIPQCGIAGP